jgi:hypothetical protein
MQLKEKHQVEQEVNIGWQCDQCGKKLFGQDLPEPWHVFHLEYWNGKEPVISWFHTCSYSCYIHQSQKEIDALREHKPYVSGMSATYLKGLIDFLIQRSSDTIRGK